MLIIITNVLQGEIVVERRIWCRIWSYATSTWKNSKMYFQKTGKLKKKGKFQIKRSLEFVQKNKGNIVLKMSK